MKKIFLSFSVFVGFVGVFNFAYAVDSVNITLKVYSGDTVLFNGPEMVTACAESPGMVDPLLFTVNGKCAVEKSGLSNTWTWKYAPSGWLDELGGYSTSPDYTKSWGWFNNLNYGAVALNQHILSSGEELLLTYNSFPLRISASKNSGTVGETITFTAEEESTFDANYNMLWTPSAGAIITLGTQSCTTVSDGTCSIVLNTPGLLKANGNKISYVPSANLDINVTTPPSSGSGGFLASISSTASATGFPIAPVSLPPAENKPVVETKPVFDIKKAFEFIISQQKENGSFGENIYTDWTALALASRNYQEQTLKLIKYLEESKLENPFLTDYERRVMATMALGLNPYSINGENYIGKISASFDGKQFGDANEDNDDIFALIVLQNAGYKQDEKIISDDVSFVLGKQKENGSWDESVDLTGAAIESLSAFSLTPGVRESLTKARGFLKQNQKDDGSWGNISSTAWAMEGISGLSEKPGDWIKNGNTPLDYLASMQDADGGIKNENIQSKIWETAYVISALSGKTWNQIMQKFEKPKPLVIIAKISKKLTKKQEITATAINAVTNSPLPTQKETPKQNWFIKLLESIFNVF